MGAFLLVSDNAGHFNKKEALETMGMQCGTTPVHFVFQGWELYLFPKRLVNALNFRGHENLSIFVTGTPYFEGMNYSSSLDRMHNDIKRREDITNDLKGVYFLLIQKDNSLSFSVDPGGIYSIYHSADRSVISSSFLALCTGLTSLSPDRETITENLATGSVIGSDTIFKEIKRFEPQYPVTFKGLRFNSNCPTTPELKFTNKKAGILYQINTLNEHFDGIKKIVEETGIVCGITGGLDSRLLLSLVRNHFRREAIQFHSHFRHKPDIDFLTGQELCKKLNNNFVSFPYREFSQLNREESENVLKRCMLFTDGQIRTHSFWHEEFNSAENHSLTMGGMSLSMSGIGGEQYRNSERLITDGWNKSKWIENNLVRKSAGKSFICEKDEKELVNRLDAKISERLGIREKHSISLIDIKRYNNEVFVPANRGLRCVHENRLSFSLMPFADFVVSHTAYASVEYLGASIEYEAEMINLIDPEAAAVQSAYGFQFNKPEPVMKYLPYVIFENTLPWGIKQKLSEKLLKRNTPEWRDLIENIGILKDAVESVKELFLPLDLDRLAMRKDLGPLIFAMGYLLNSFESKIKYDG
jgi:hypothetical protein